MGLQNKVLTDGEKAVLFYHVFGGFDDWEQMYIIADRDKDAAQNKFFASLVSRWKNSTKVLAFLDEIKKQQADHDADSRNQGRQEEKERQEKDAESERTASEGGAKFSGPVDYSDPANRKRLYNSVIARSKDDPRTQLDAAKLFEQIQKDDREAARTQKVVRSYLPIRCNSCPLYIKAAEKATK